MGNPKNLFPNSNGQLSLFEEDQPTVVSNEETIDVLPHKRKKKGVKAEELANLPTFVEDHKLSPEDKLCQHCESEMVDCGTSTVRTEVEFLQAKLRTLLHRQHAYVCKTCEREGITSIKKAAVPKPLIPSSFGSPSVVTETIMQKYQQKVPAYRQEKYWNNLDLAISRDNICRGHVLVSQQVLQPLFELLRKELIQQSAIHSDETSYQVIQNVKARTYYWVRCSVDVVKTPIVLYQHSESRGHEVPKKFLEGYSGYIHCDGWGAHPNIPNVTTIACGAHIRRKFYETLGDKKEPNKESPAYIGLEYWNRMFKVETTLKGLHPEERQKLPEEKLKPLFDEFWDWVSQLNFLPNSKLDTAVQYAAKNKAGVYRILEMVNSNFPIIKRNG